MPPTNDLSHTRSFVWLVVGLLTTQERCGKLASNMVSGQEERSFGWWYMFKLLALPRWLAYWWPRWSDRKQNSYCLTPLP